MSHLLRGLTGRSSSTANCFGYFRFWNFLSLHLSLSRFVGLFLPKTSQLAALRLTDKVQARVAADETNKHGKRWWDVCDHLALLFSFCGALKRFSPVKLRKSNGSRWIDSRAEKKKSANSVINHHRKSMNSDQVRVLCSPCLHIPASSR